MQIKIKIENFEGPMDLLLHLVSKKEMEIEKINISNLIENYLLYIEEARVSNALVKVEFLLMATELMKIKALAILNKKEKEEKEEELEYKILEYKKYKEISEKLRDLENEYNISYTKQGKEIEIIKSEEEIDVSKLTVQRLFKEYDKIINKKDKIEEELEVDLEKNFSTEDAYDEIKAGFFKQRKLIFSDLLKNTYSKIKIVCMFLVILDMYKLGEIEIQQDKEIYIEYMG